MTSFQDQFCSPCKLVYPKVKLYLWEACRSKKLPILVPETPPSGQTAGQVQPLQSQDGRAHESSGCEGTTKHLVI